ncbi:MAG: carbohydrate kinase [Actinomycetota bacterium]|nr:carbohydrate kinase [Actinomycetota bacterium]
MTASPRVVVCGETVVDLVQSGSRSWTSHPGGSPANVAVGLARLSVPVAMLARLSGDAFGGMLREHLRDAGVDLGLAVAAQEPSTLAVASLDAAGVATYDFWVEGTADWQWADGELPERLPDAVRALHTGSMALEVEPGASRVRALLQRVHGQVLVSYDPNVRLARRGDREVGLAAVEQVVALADVVKVSSEDLDWLLPGTPVEDVLRRWRALGPALVVVTTGGDGAVGLAGGGPVRVPVPPVQVVDTVGAGDAFSAGLLAGLADAGLLERAALEQAPDAALTEVLTLAARVASITCTRPGSDPPTREELHAAVR